MGGSSAIFQHHAGKRLYNSGECEMSVKHKWHNEIKAWADGAEIEYSVGQEWNPTSNPTWEKLGMVYRIKPQPKSDTSIAVLERDYNFMRDLAIGTEELLHKTIQELNEVKETLAQRNLELMEAQDKLIKQAISIPQPNRQQCCCQQKVTPSPQYLYAYFDNYINRITITDAKSNVNAVDYLGKIKLEVDDE